MGGNVFTQTLSPAGPLWLTFIVAIIPLALLLLLLPVLRRSAWIAAVAGSVVTFLIALWVWNMPLDEGLHSYLYGALTGAWAIDWITFWGVMIFNTLVITGMFERFRVWLVSVATADVRIQTLLFAWAFGALLEGLVGFGYPWAFVAPILIALGIPELDSLRVAAIANNAPVSYGALGSPIIALAAVTGLPLLALSASVGEMVALLALLPPWILIYLVSGKRGLRDGWPLAIVASLGYIAGQLPVSVFVGPYLPDVAGAIVAFAVILLFTRMWRPATMLGYGGAPLSAAQMAAHGANKVSGRELVKIWLPFIILIVVVVAGTGPWSHLPALKLYSAHVDAVSAITGKTTNSAFNFTPFSGGTWILISWILISLVVGLKPAQYAEAFKRTFRQMWGALLVGFLIFGLAFVYNYSGMAGSLAYSLSRIGPWYILLAPVVGLIGVALSGSNTSTNAMFGTIQLMAGKLLNFPVLLLPTLNSLGAEVGKPIAPQTASVGVSTTSYVRKEGVVIRYNFGWALVVLGWLIIVGLFYYFIAPGVMLM
jgi:lactate permease